jgi:hypothetical protein
MISIFTPLLMMEKEIPFSSIGSAKVRFPHKTVIDPPTMKEGLIKALKGVQMATGSGTDGLSRLHALIL